MLVQSIRHYDRTFATSKSHRQMCQFVDFVANRLRYRFKDVLKKLDDCEDNVLHIKDLAFILREALKLQKLQLPIK